MAKLTKVSQNCIVVNVAHKDAIQLVKLHPDTSVKFMSNNPEIKQEVEGMEATVALMLEQSGAYILRLSGDNFTRYEVTIN